MISIKDLRDDEKCFEAVLKLRWAQGAECPHCREKNVGKRGMHSTQGGRQRYECHGCGKQFDDLTGTVFEGHHRPLRTWIMCAYMMGLNLSNQQIAELDLNKDQAQAMATAWREGVEVKKAHHPERGGRGRRDLHRGRPQPACSPVPPCTPTSTTSTTAVRLNEADRS
jgi:transposase-like protein